jgi:hypothetical protein
VRLEDVCKAIHTVSKNIPLRVFVMEIIRELLAVFMSAKDPENNCSTEVRKMRQEYGGGRGN